MILPLAAMLLGLTAAPLPPAAAEGPRLAAACTSAVHAAEDDDPPPTPPPTGVHALLSGLVEDVKHLPSTENLLVAATGGAAALAVHPMDATFNQRLSTEDSAANAFWAPGKWVGQTPVQMALALGTYAYGRAKHKDKVSHLAMDLLRAQILAGGMTGIIKFTVRRERPDGSDNLSFPSGHSSVTFASATVIERHLGWRYSVVGYAIASYVAASRLHDDRHYLSDVVFGAAVGVIGGRTVTEHGRNTWTFAPASVPGGVAVFAMRTGR